MIGFAAETSDVERHAKGKLARKGCDWIVANDVSGDVMGGADNEVLLVTRAGTERWPRMGKAEVAMRLAERIAARESDLSLLNARIGELEDRLSKRRGPTATLHVAE